MTIIDRAARAIQPYEPRNGTARDVAIDLASADLLAPDLPPVTKPKPGSPEWDAYVADWDAEPLWETPERHGFSAGHEDGSVNVYVFRDGYTIADIDILPPEEAEALGLALLAAANHAREHDAS
ncbi:hypothetical protein HMPREF2998_02965 [Corynebacterium sp. HMSC065A05]|uniref:hypothetical protein n=1 Tax=Corynebacterium sp. HMSC065A05 TaxID=1739502 RepID=UPI0008A1E807|nr:hypothetical protein [Corynebacterium sp. HMSC065A05]OFP17166.1 hypothetical protein HMPREF2998_02965 [Corynebacterium sp. HMSC065A05]